ncbi:MAG TPA: prephenate dehydrogenase/arogenate dehydrogenase family protein [Patescibacteria group bacterium]|nr:prephenate dehydrogenase/arogenate dehydrogenase family protein [Patescibacteria group bacterium]
MKFGIIGYGSFGKLLTDVLSSYGQVVVFGRSDIDDLPKDNIKIVDELKDLSDCNVIILAVGLDSLDDTSKKLADIVGPNTLVADVCSVKVKPIEILTKNLGKKCKLLFTHPLFGPQTVENGVITGNKIVICSGEDFKGRTEIMNFFKYQLKLDVIKMSAEDHDREMAWVHALTFFVGRGLMEINPPKSHLSTGYYQKLLDLVELEASHSIELFNTVQRGNPFAEEIRKKLLDKLGKIDQEIGGN